MTQLELIKSPPATVLCDSCSVPFPVKALPNAPVPMVCSYCKAVAAGLVDDIENERAMYR